MTSDHPDSPEKLRLNRSLVRMLWCLMNRSAQCAVVFCLVVAGCVAPRSLPYPFESREADVVEALLARDSTWRLAVDSDSKSTAAISALREVDAAFRPYFARDTSRARGLGLAFVLTRASEFRVFYLRGDGVDALVVDEVAAMSWLDDGFVRLRGDSLDIALFNSGEIMSFVWDSSTRNMVLLPEALPEDAIDTTRVNRPPSA